jgi:hypothetical protein
MDREPATARLSGQVWRRIVIVAAMVAALVAGVVAVAGRTMASEPGVSGSRLEAPPADPSCRDSSPSLSADGSARIAGPKGQSCDGRGRRRCW